MRKSILVTILFLLFFVVTFTVWGLGRRDRTDGVDPQNQLFIWTTDSFVSEWGPGPEVARVFEEKTGIRITWVNRGSAGIMVSRLLLEGENAVGDIVLGIDQNLAGRILEANLLEAYRPNGAEKLLPQTILDPYFRLIPMDYSYFAIVYDSERVGQPPRSLEDLTDARFRQNLILIDPRTSSVGLGFFGWVREVYGDGWRDYWRRLRPSILTISEGWSSAYGLFTRGESTMVLSYTTSPGSHLEFEGTERFRAAIFPEGHAMQIQAGGLLRNARNVENAKAFLDFMISPYFQNIIPLTNWTYPVIDIPLPASFRINPKSDRPLMPAPATEAELNEWAALMRE